MLDKIQVTNLVGPWLLPRHNFSFTIDLDIFHFSISISMVDIRRAVYYNKKSGKFFRIGKLDIHSLKLVRSIDFYIDFDID